MHTPCRGYNPMNIWGLCCGSFRQCDLCVGEFPTLIGVMTLKISHLKWKGWPGVRPFFYFGWSISSTLDRLSIMWTEVKAHDTLTMLPLESGGDARLFW